MSQITPNSGQTNRDASKPNDKRSPEPIFHSIEAQDGAGTDRAHIIAIWTGLFIFAIVVSQFGRPSQAREAEFLRSSAKVAALGKPAQRVLSVSDSLASGATAHSRIEVANVNSVRSDAGGNEVARSEVVTRSEDEKELTPAVYVSHKYGVAWQYPRNYVLRKGANANLDLYGHAATDSAFASTGGVTLASVIIPARVFAGTDFASAALTARVNARISEDDCGKFRRASFDTGDNAALASSPETVGTIDFSAAHAEDKELQVAKAANGAPGSSAREKFYHVYENDACYEFAMRVNTGRTDGATAQASVDQEAVFDRLAEILTSVTIVPVRAAAAAAEAHGN